jgi:hypothetical protein
VLKATFCALHKVGEFGELTPYIILNSHLGFAGFLFQDDDGT